MSTEQEIPQPFSSDYNQPGESRLDYLARVEKAGLEVVVPAPNQVQIDIDGVEQYEKYVDLIKILSSGDFWVNIDNIKEIPSRSNGPGKYHITITFDRPISDWERIAWQASLGSDCKRELFSCVRLRNNEPIPICFFEKKADQNPQPNAGVPVA